MEAGEPYSGEWWVRSARLKKCLIKFNFVTGVSKFSRQERREHGRHFSCAVRGRHEIMGI